MNNELLIAALAGLGGMLGWGLADFFAKKTIDKIGDVASLAWGHIFGSAVLVAALLYQSLIRHQPAALPVKVDTWLLLALFGAAQATVYLFVYKGFGKGQLAILNPIFASFSGITALLSILVFKETVSGYLIFGLLVLFVGIILISADFGALRAKRFDFSHMPGFKEVGFATLLASLWTLYWDRFLGGQDWLTYTLVMYVFMTVVIWIVAKFNNTKLKIPEARIWKFLILIGLCETVAYLAITLGYSKTSFNSVVALLSGAFSLPTIILARAFLKEKITTLQTVGGAVIIIGIILLAIF